MKQLWSGKQDLKVILYSKMSQAHFLYLMHPTVVMGVLTRDCTILSTISRGGLSNTEHFTF